MSVIKVSYPSRLIFIRSVNTPHGPARVDLRPVERPRAALVLGHGAGGGIGSPDLTAASKAAQSVDVSVALVEQPYRVAGRRSPAPAPQLDAAWLAVMAYFRKGPLAGLPIVVGGRSSGARVACRTAAQADALAVLCLAFPLHAPGRGGDPLKSRLPELDAVEVPTLVVQGERDPFGMPPAGPDRTVVRVPGNHSLRTVTPIVAAVSDWLAELKLRPPRRARRPRSERDQTRARAPRPTTRSAP